MSKLYGLQGYITGKLGNTVFAVRNGQQVARMYNPVVSNPKTDAQIEVRSKLKLLSQLSSSIRNVIAIRRQGPVSARNLFVSRNFPFATYNSLTANVHLADIQLTNSSLGLAGFSLDRTAGSTMKFEMAEDISGLFDKIVYVVLKRTSAGGIAPAGEFICDIAGTNGTFPKTVAKISGAISAHAYGIRLLSEEARVKFNNLNVSTNASVATLLVSQKFSEGDFSLSETRGFFMNETTTQGSTSGATSIIIGAKAYDNDGAKADEGGIVTGAGEFNSGDTVTLVATPASGYIFKGWAESAGGTIVTTDNPFVFVASADKTYFAIFELAQNPVVTALKGDNASALVITGAGQHAQGTTVSLVADTSSLPSGTAFKGWYDNANGTGTALSTSTTYSFTMGSSNVTVYAVCETTAAETYTLNLAVEGGDISFSDAGINVTGTGVVKVNDTTYTVPAGTQISLEAASSYGNNDFVEWMSNASGSFVRISTSTHPTYTVNSNCTCKAVYQQGGE